MLQKYQNLDPVIRQLKSWHKYKTKPTKADTRILGKKTLLRYFRKHNNTTINEITDLLEYQTPHFKVPCLPLSMMLIAFNISHTQHTKGHSGSIIEFHSTPISPSSEGNSYIKVIVDAFTHYVALNPLPLCKDHYAYTTLYEHWIAKFGLPEILVTDNGREFINNEIITLCHLYNIKHEQRTSHAPWINGLVEGMNRSLQEYLRCIINGNDTRYTEWSTDVKLFPLS